MQICSYIVLHVTRVVPQHLGRLLAQQQESVNCFNIPHDLFKAEPHAVCDRQHMLIYALAMCSVPAEGAFGGGECGTSASFVQGNDVTLGGACGDGTFTTSTLRNPSCLHRLNMEDTRDGHDEPELLLQYALVSWQRCRSTVCIPNTHCATHPAFGRCI